MHSDRHASLIITGKAHPSLSEDQSLTSTTTEPASDNGGPIIRVGRLRRTLPVELGRLRLIDIRPRQAYRAGHLPGALSADLFHLGSTASNPEGVDAFVITCRLSISRLGNRAGERVVYCEHTSSPFAAWGVWIPDLLAHGGGGDP